VIIGPAHDTSKGWRVQSEMTTDGFKLCAVAARLDPCTIGVSGRLEHDEPARSIADVPERRTESSQTSQAWRGALDARRGVDRMTTSLRDHGEWGVVLQLFETRAFIFGRRYDTPEITLIDVDARRRELEADGWSARELAT
jgi:hypothetical protein